MYSRIFPLILLVQLVNGLIAIVEIFLGLRFLLKLLGANPGAPFVAWVYDMTTPLLTPFRDIFPSPVLKRGYILEFSTLFAVVIYAIIGWLIVEFINFISRSASGDRRIETRTTVGRTE